MAERLRLPLEQPLMTYPSLGNLMDAVQQEDMGEDLLEKVREMTSEESKGGKGEKSVEVDTDLSWDHEGLRPLPKAPKDRLNGSPKLPRVLKIPKAGGNTEGTFKKECPSFGAGYKEGKYPEPTHKENKVGMVDPQEEKLVPEIDKKNGKNDERWDFESPENLVDKKTARWIEEQNEFLGKQEEKEFERDKKERDPPVFNPSGPIKVLQKQRANHRTGYEQKPTFNGCSKTPSSTSSYGCDK